jgi:hypothetical protein
MTGDSLTRFLFWLGLGFEVIISLATGLLVSIVFVTLQLRRDLQTQLDEIWLLARRTAEAVYSAQTTANSDEAVNQHWGDLENEWLRARRTLKFALTGEKWEQLHTAIYAIQQLHQLNVNPEHERFLKLHPLKITDETGTHERPDAIDYGTWAEENNLPEERHAYLTFLVQRYEIDKKIQYLLYFNPDLLEQEGAAADAKSLPTELEQSWHFTYLFPRALKWFFSELFSSVRKSFRDQCRESENQRRK